LTRHAVSINLKVNLIFRVNCHVIFVLIMTVGAQDGVYYLTQYDNNIIRTFARIFSKGTQLKYSNLNYTYPIITYLIFMLVNWSWLAVYLNKMTSSNVDNISLTFVIGT